MIRIGFIGCGNMGGALASAAAKCKSAEVLLYDKDTAKAEALAEKLGAKAVSLDNVCGAGLVFLGVKPNIISSVADETRDAIKASGAVIVSMAAGVSIGKLEAAFGDAPVIRIMPNTPAEVGKGMIL